MTGIWLITKLSRRYLWTYLILATRTKGLDWIVLGNRKSVCYFSAAFLHYSPVSSVILGCGRAASAPLAATSMTGTDVVKKKKKTLCRKQICHCAN